MTTKNVWGYSIFFADWEWAHVKTVTTYNLVIGFKSDKSEIFLLVGIDYSSEVSDNMIHITEKRPVKMPTDSLSIAVFQAR